ncbi:YiiX/YebB-like N1pC/P60 family cysteine hydrolase [Thermoactinomyces sp. DSM 45892]|uniref:YiiX/YebB-like N1pC/P60 family cysteine hydrolase n=1 Tax=Thermoactinomyces sp. DSM 45892 TaxID=1882753 RepID=UPI00089C5C7E|nr:YiiX/YebB-like N1pC/P60 family cysteine hydrolase [Thermoactinomyces sp. DSM 45892]SDX93257.1 Permuted papain-like amidase enzyme, YaeF/YiiX, C92 family [Thermoactinomyces sp. DSM 45892]
MVKKIVASSLAVACLLTTSSVFATESESSIQKKIAEANQDMQETIKNMPKEEQGAAEKEWERSQKVYEEFLRKEVKVDSEKVAEALRLKFNDPNITVEDAKNLGVLGFPPSHHTRGDVFITWDNQSSSFRYGHAGIGSHTTYLTVESFPEDGVAYKARSRWPRLMNKWAAYLVDGAKSDEYQSAASFSENSIGKPYSWSFLNKKRTDRYYCSSLVWRAWVNQGYDLDADGGGGVFPFDIDKSKKAIAYYTEGF